jgi:hypothetical protein
MLVAVATLLLLLLNGERVGAAPLPPGHGHHRAGLHRNASSSAAAHTRQFGGYDDAATWELVSRMPQARLGLTSSYDEVRPTDALPCRHLHISVLLRCDPAPRILTHAPRSFRRGLSPQVSGRIYSLGGEQFATVGDWAESVNPSVDIVEWREEQPMPVSRFQAAAAATPGRVYTMGGFGVEGGSAPIDSMVSIDTATGQWRTETPMPTPRALLSAVYVPGGKIYAMGGRGAQDPFDPVVPIVESYDPVTGARCAR